MRSYTNSNDLSDKIKAGLQVCHKSINKEKYSGREFRLFSILAETYLQKEKVREYPKAVAIYQYLKKLVEKHLNGDKEVLALLEQRIKAVEASFLGKVRELKSYVKSKEHDKLEELGVTDINVYKGELSRFREEIKKELAAIEDLGIEKGKEELNEEGLQKRAQEIERIYIGIREFFIGKRDETGELTEPGLVNKLINDCIKQLGGLPKVGKDNHECVYAIFGMGSLALATMTPWSDLEFGVLIEEGLIKEEEERVKDYFRRLTTLLHIKIVNFGETPLRVMGVEELNNFKIQEETDKEHNWFYDSLVKPGFSFDGPNWHACKTPLGRKKGYMRIARNGGIGIFIPCISYELIGTIDELMGFYRDINWRKEDPQLVQSLGHVELISGYRELILKYRKTLIEHRELIESLAFNILKEDSDKFDPFKQILDEDKEGHILKAKKGIYRFADRIIVALGDCLGGEGISSWRLIKSISKTINKQRQDLWLALSIAAEIRLRTYTNNGGQIEDISAIAKYESQIKELKESGQLEQIFYLKNRKLLYDYCFIVLELSFKIKKIKNKKSLNILNQIKFKENEYSVIKGYTYVRFLLYYEAIKEFEKLNYSSSNALMFTLANLYRIVGKNEKALKIYRNLNSKISSHIKKAAVLNNIGVIFEILGMYEKALRYKQASLKMEKGAYYSDHPSIAGTINNIGLTLEKLGRHEEALMYLQKSLEIVRGHYKENTSELAALKNNIGMTLDSLGEYEEALKYYRESLEIKIKIYKGDHVDIVGTLNNIGTVLDKLSKYEEALRYKQESLEMGRRIYKGSHIGIAASLNNIGMTIEKLGKHEEALRYYQESLGIMYELYKGDHAYIAGALNNIGTTLGNMSRYEEALEYYQKSLEMRYRIYTEKHIDIAMSLINISAILQYLGRYEEALEHAAQSVEMIKLFLSEEHPYAKTTQNQLFNCTVSVANQEIFLRNYDKALESYKNIGIVLKKEDLERTTSFFASQYWQIGKSDLAINCYEVLNEILLPQDRGIKHNLACTYHVKAIKEKNNGKAISYQKYLCKAKEMFQKALSLDSVEKIMSSLYTEYAMFLMINHDLKDETEYSIIVANAILAISQKGDGSGLSYSQIEKATTVEPIQKLLGIKDEVAVKPYLLAYYLLVKAHCLHNNKEQAEEALKEFNSQIELLKRTEDEEMAQYLFNWSGKEIAICKRNNEGIRFEDRKDNQDVESQNIEKQAAIVIQRSWRKYIESRREVSSSKYI